jgi:hypothetical protein
MWCLLSEYWSIEVPECYSSGVLRLVKNEVNSSTIFMNYIIFEKDYIIHTFKAIESLYTLFAKNYF